MKKFMNRANTALSSEDGGPNLEQIIGFSLALIVAAALFLFGDKLSTWINGAGDVVNNFKTQ